MCVIRTFFMLFVLTKTTSVLTSISSHLCRIFHATTIRRVGVVVSATFTTGDVIVIDYQASGAGEMDTVRRGWIACLAHVSEQFPKDHLVGF